MPSWDQLLKREGRGSISPAVPGEGIGEVVYADRRASSYALCPTVFRKRKGAREVTGSQPSLSRIQLRE